MLDDSIFDWRAKPAHWSLSGDNPNTRGDAGEWPADDMNLQDNYGDLERHQNDFEPRIGFT
jgi:hypothetical protein